MSSVEPLEDGETDFRDLLLSFWQGKWFILVITALSGVIAAAVTLNIPNEYRATVVLMPATTQSSLSRLPGQLGGLASLAGLNLSGQDGNNKTIAAIELIKSWGFQEQFIRNNQLEVPVFAVRGWNIRSKQLLIDPTIYSVQQKKWLGKISATGKQTAKPSGWDLYRKLSDRISISQDKKTNFVTLSVEYYSPYLAKDWADKLVIAVNRHMQDQDRIEAERSIKYLENKISQTNLVEIKSAFFHLLEEQTKNLMLTNVNDEYVLKTLSPAKVPEEKSGPKRAAICLASTLAGGFISVMCWLIWSMIRRRSKNA